jgi:mannose-6-phosphate isomerase-like protein (cupin superfamily)
MNRRALMSGAILASIAATTVALAVAAPAEEPVSFTDLDTLLKEKPLSPGGPDADVIAWQHVAASELQIVVARKIDLHIHEDATHRIYVARGSGVFRFAGQSRPVKVGDILTVPKGMVHGFETPPSSGPLVLLVVETPN